jgi:hypothetical protein
MKETHKAKLHEVTKNVSKIRERVLEQVITLSTSSFGLVAALAWNDLIKETIEMYIKPYLGASSGIISKLLYAVIVTILAVFITVQLSRMQTKTEKE